MTVQYTTAGWAHALTTVLAQAVDDSTLWDAARRLLTAGAAGPLNVNKGFATTKFSLPNGRVARPRLLVTELTATDWDRIETAIRARPDAAVVAGTAAISDQLTDPVNTAGIPIVPGPLDITHTCNCGDNSIACSHSVALGILLAERLRTAPAPLFTLRGRPHQHLKKQLRGIGTASRHAETQTSLESATVNRVHPDSAQPVTVQPTAPVPAQPDGALPSIPDPVHLDLTGARPVLSGPLTEPPAPLPAAEALSALAADAAHRAAACLGGVYPLPGTEAAGDIARLLRLPHGAAFRQTAMDYLGLDIVGMGHLQLAYAHGGPGGAAAYLEPYTIDHDVLAQAQARIQPLRPAATATIECEHNRLTDKAAGVQLRYGPDGRWHPYRAPYGIWQPVPGPSSDAAQAYCAARRTNQRTS